MAVTEGQGPRFLKGGKVLVAPAKAPGNAPPSDQGEPPPAPPMPREGPPQAPDDIPEGALPPAEPPPPEQLAIHNQFEKSLDELLASKLPGPPSGGPVEHMVEPKVKVHRLVDPTRTEAAYWSEEIWCEPLGRMASRSEIGEMEFYGLL